MLNTKSALFRSISLVLLLFLVWDITLPSQQCPNLTHQKTEILQYPYYTYLTSLGKKQYKTTVTTLFLYMIIRLSYQTTIYTQF